MTTTQLIIGACVILGIALWMWFLAMTAPVCRCRKPGCGGDCIPNHNSNHWPHWR